MKDKRKNLQIKNKENKLLQKNRKNGKRELLLIGPHRDQGTRRPSHYWTDGKNSCEFARCRGQRESNEQTTPSR
jgi:hypothetical protein